MMVRDRDLNLLLVLSLLALSACASSRTHIASEHRGWEAQTPPPNAELAYRVFLLGDAGNPSLDGSNPVLSLLKRQLHDAGSQSAVIFLGNNVSCCGLPDSGTVNRPVAEKRLRAQLKAVEDYQGQVVFIPGNHDWARGNPHGLAALTRQEDFIESHFDGSNVFRPDNGFPGPDVLNLADGIKLVVLDTQWWLHAYDKTYGDAGDYEINEDSDFFLELEDIIQRYDKDKMLIVGHHPVFSNGAHAGVLPLKDHLFPLTRLLPGAYLPLPIVGSLYPLYRRSVGLKQDLAHARYRLLREGLLRQFRKHENLIYAAGHDHSLQYFYDHDQHYLVSGAGSVHEPVSGGGGAGFVADRPGFMQVYYYQDGSTWLEAWTANDAPEGRVLFRTEINGPAPDQVDPGLPTGGVAETVDYSDSTIVIAADKDLVAGSLWRFFWGNNLRKVWAIPLEVPYLDLGREAGGLTPIKKGGGLQSTSLRLRGADGEEYVLRSVKKDPSKALSEDLRKTFVGALSRDLVSSQHPYGAYIIPSLADAAGVYHTNPRLVYVPKDPRLGIYKEALGGQLMLFEERPKGAMPNAPHFGNPTDVESSPAMVRSVTDDNDHQVDQRALARVRLFDLLLSDWDRHSDQWRWATLKDDGQATYRPIPRDRDTAFNRLNGLLPGLTKPFLKYQDFRTSYGNLKGLTLNAWRLDHRFLSSLERSDWIEIADSIRTGLTDEIIEQAIQRWPQPVYELHGEQTILTLKARRHQLSEIAEKFYELHAESVDVLGSNKHERFEAHRLNNDETEVVVYKTKKDGEILRELYRRTFHRDDTGEILLYGLGGIDRFEISGEVDHGITILAMGGPGEDHFTDQSRVGGFRKKTRFYDTDTGNHWTPGPETKIIRSDDPAINRYHYEVRYDSLRPTLVFASDRDDGFTLGGGLSMTKIGRRKKPYAQSHLVTGFYALDTKAIQINYQGHFVADFGGWDVILNTHWKNPDNTQNFFGFGNETRYNDDTGDAFNQARLSQVFVAPALRKQWHTGVTVQVGGYLNVTDISKDGDRFIGLPEAGISERTFDTQWYMGPQASVIVGDVDRAVNPRQGMRWTNTASLNIGLDNTEGTFGKVSSQFMFYLSPLLSPQVTLAARIGVSHIEGNFPFYQAATLGGRENLRGYRNERFAGRSSFFQNAELRISLLDFNSYLVSGQVGILGFYDNGRVWIDDESSGVWHNGYGGGLWISVLDRFLLNGTMGYSDEETRLMIGMGFLY